MYEHEQAFIRAFVVREQRGRFLGWVRFRHSRNIFVNEIGSAGILDPRYAKLIPAAEHDVEGLLARLRNLGAPKQCYLISNCEDIDEQTMDLREGLEACHRCPIETIVSCIPGKLALLDSEVDLWLCIRR